MRCILHIGTEKTGSTSIQRYLLHNRDVLHASGVYICTSAGKGNNRALPAAFMSDDKQDDFIRQHKLENVDARKFWKEGILESISAEVLQASQSAKVFVISSEHFHSRLLKADEVMDLHSFLTPLFDEINVFCYLRRQDRMAVSLYSQVLKAGFTPDTFFPLDVSSQDLDFQLYFDFRALLERWSLAFGEENIFPRIYSHDALMNSDVLDDFLQVTGLGCAGDRDPGKKNLSLSEEAMATLLWINRRMAKVSSTSANALRKEIVSYLEESGAGEPGRPKTVEAKVFYNAFTQSNEAVARRWFGKTTLFDEDFSEYPVRKMAVDTERVLDIVVEFMLSRVKLPE